MKYLIKLLNKSNERDINGESKNLIYFSQLSKFHYASNKLIAPVFNGHGIQHRAALESNSLRYAHKP